jgi:hypothetical protein
VMHTEDCELLLGRGSCTVPTSKDHTGSAITVSRNTVRMEQIFLSICYSRRR